MACAMKVACTMKNYVMEILACSMKSDLSYKNLWKNSATKMACDLKSSKQVDCEGKSTLWCENWHVTLFVLYIYILFYLPIKAATLPPGALYLSIYPQKVACAYKMACAMESGLIYNKWPVSQNVTFAMKSASWYKM